MTPDEVALLLTKASAVDQRTIGETDVLAWHEILHRVELVDAVDAVRRHYSASRERIMPADVLRIARTVREDRQRQQQHEVRELPGKFEDDAERDARMRNGAAKVRAVIAPLVARMSVGQERQWQRTRTEAPGAWWEDEAKREEHARSLLAEMGRLRLDHGDAS